MNKYNAEELLKSQCATQGAAGMGSVAGALGIDKCAEPGLRERIHSQRNRAERESSNADALRELEYLIEKNPEVFRMLELLDRVKY